MKKLLMFLGLILIVSLCACTTNNDVTASSKHGLEKYTKTRVGMCHTAYEYVDKDTGVHYLIVTPNWNEKEVAITPMYGQDGTLKVGE